ncbi:MAG: hypothetical protein SGJ18_08165 [Pseudomonadota bacterium]|nr:hypothetical protein [Pseudomonadota bacterium]
MKLSKLLMPILVVASAMTTMVGCGGGGGEVDTYYAGWYNVYGAQCGNLGPGCNYYANGLQIIDIEDPYFQNDYYLEYDLWSYYDTYGTYSLYAGWAWISPTGVLYDAFGTALNEKKSEGRDHVGDVVEAEEKVVAGAAGILSEKYGLSLDTGMHVARTLNDWAVIGQDRARTKDDIASVTQKLYGIDVSEVKLALEKAAAGDLVALDLAADKAASNWGTTPETFKEIQKTWFAKQIKQYSK